MAAYPARKLKRLQPVAGLVFIARHNLGLHTRIDVRIDCDGLARPGAERQHGAHLRVVGQVAIDEPAAAVGGDIVADAVVVHHGQRAQHKLSPLGRVGAHHYGLLPAVARGRRVREAHRVGCGIVSDIALGESSIGCVARGDIQRREASHTPCAVALHAYTAGLHVKIESRHRRRTVTETAALQIPHQHGDIIAPGFQIADCDRVDICVPGIGAALQAAVPHHRIAVDDQDIFAVGSYSESRGADSSGERHSLPEAEPHPVSRFAA